MTKAVKMEAITLLDLFTKEELQEKQNLFSEAMGVASIITLPDGSPVTQPSNFCRLCFDIIRNTPAGKANCFKSDASIGQANKSEPTIMPCLGGGLWSARLSIMLGNNHIGNWLVGQVKNEDIDIRAIKSYAKEIGANEKEFLSALDEVPEMSLKQFTNTARMLHAFVNELTQKAFSNHLLKEEIKKRETVSQALLGNQKKLQENKLKLIRQNHDYFALNEELKQSNKELSETLEILSQSKLELNKQNAEYLRVNEELNRINNKYVELNEELNQTNEEYLSLNDEIKNTNLELTSTLEKLKESNNRYKSLLQAVPDLIFIFTKEDVFIDYHIPPDSHIFSPPNFFMNKNIKEVVLPEISEKHINARIELFKTSKPQTYQYSSETNFGTRYYVSTMVKQGEDKVLTIVRDITQLEKTRQLEKEIDITRKSSEFKQKFLANMSHEIRTPLTGMLGLIEIVGKTPLNEQQRIYIENLRQSGENLRHIINLILDYSKIESGKIAIKPTVIQTLSIFDNATNLFQSIAPKSVTLIKEINENVPDVIKIDIQRVNQILNNLLSNAIKFTEKGTITINLLPDKPMLSYETGNLCKLRVEVIDTGPGIDPQLQKHLFKPFSQIESNELRTMEGTGLGLSICKELSGMLGGEIGINSKPGKGSKFWFTFIAEIASENKITKIATNGSYTLEKKSCLNVLLVEDKKVNQMVVSLMLKQMGHQVTLAGNGVEAIEKFQPKTFDLILMDIQMPVMDGITATQQLRKVYDSLPPIIGLSANAFEGDREKYMSMGLDEYLTKPIDSKSFTNILSQFH